MSGSVLYVDVATGSDALNTGTNPDAPKQTIKAAVDALAMRSGVVHVAAGLYEVLEPIPLNSRQSIIGASRSNIGTVASGSTGVVVRAMPGFVGDYVFDHPDGAVGASWHWATLENIGIDGNKAAGVNVGGVHVFEWGEESVIRRVAANNCARSGYLFTGTHAVGRMEDFSASGCDDYGVKITADSLAGQSSGSLSLVGSSGDNCAPGWLYHSGSASVTEVSPKHEKMASSAYAWFTIDGAGTGGGRARLSVLGGRLDCAAIGGAAGASVVRILGTARPSVTLENVSTPNAGTVVDDRVLGRSIATSANQSPALLVYGMDGNDSIHLGTPRITLPPRITARGTATDNVALLLSNGWHAGYSAGFYSNYADESFKMCLRDDATRKMWRINGGNAGRSQTFSTYTGTGAAVDSLKLDEDGIWLAAQTNPLPVASATYRGQVRRIAGGPGVADRLVICRKDAADAYAWTDLL